MAAFKGVRLTAFYAIIALMSYFMPEIGS
jgi:hypothetical protein